MDADSALASAPRRIRVKSAQGETRYRLAEELIAIHGAARSRSAIVAFEGDGIVVEALASRRRFTEMGKALGPVYRQQPAGTVAVPTGRVFVRFAEGERAEDHRAELAASGYQLEHVPSYSPGAAWTRHVSGSVTAALRELDQLGRIPAVEHVEPQFLSQPGLRS